MNNTFPTDPTAPNPNKKTSLEICVIILAISFIVAGISIIFFAIRELYLTYQNVEGNHFFTITTNFFTDKTFITLIDNGTKTLTVINEGAAKIISLIFLLFFVSIAASMGGSLLKLGVKILPNRRDNSRKMICQSEDGNTSMLINKFIEYHKEK